MLQLCIAGYWSRLVHLSSAVPKNDQTRLQGMPGCNLGSQLGRPWKSLGA